ncbi:MAG: hypothetical protein ABJF86_10480 [Tateyamaria sp.]|uniref:hypothetical protein n=1 Tax=Tateyamaria sp. TaxID=1929288 RepID=UPI00328ACB33
MSYDLETLRYTERRLAALVVANPVYVPLFVRVQNEIEILTNTQDTVAKAKAIADSYKAVA